MPDDEDSEQSVDDQSSSQQTTEDQTQEQGTADEQDQEQTSQDQTQDQGTTDEQSQEQQTPEDQSQDQGTTDEQSQDQQTPEDQSQEQGTADEQGQEQTSQDQGTTDEQSQGQQTSQDRGQNRQTTGDQAGRQTPQSGVAGSKQSFVGQTTGATQRQSTGAPDWRGRAKRALTVLQNDSSGEATRTKCMFNHILEESHSDSYISKDFYNVQQTAGGLPANMSMEQFLAAITGHIRAELGSTAFGDSRGGEQSDSDFRSSVLTFDSNIRHHITFLNGVAHQAAAGKVHLALWKLILDSRKDPNSLYKCYADYLVDGGWPA
jgi:hypothetical protein